MAASLTGLGRPRRIPDLPRCACGCGADGPFGFPGGVHYARACIPPAPRQPDEPGYAPAIDRPPPPGGLRART